MRNPFDDLRQLRRENLVQGNGGRRTVRRALALSRGGGFNGEVAGSRLLSGFGLMAGQTL